MWSEANLIFDFQKDEIALQIFILPCPSKTSVFFCCDLLCALFFGGGGSHFFLLKGKLFSVPFVPFFLAGFFVNVCGSLLFLKGILLSIVKKVFWVNKEVSALLQRKVYQI